MKPRFEMIEIYSGKDKMWKGWYNLILVLGEEGNYRCIQGPIDPETSLQIKKAIDTSP